MFLQFCMVICTIKSSTNNVTKSWTYFSPLCISLHVISCINITISSNWIDAHFSSYLFVSYLTPTIRCFCFRSRFCSRFRFYCDKCLLYSNQNQNQIENNTIDYINEVLNETVEDDEKENLPEDWEEGAYNNFPLHILSFFLSICPLNWFEFIPIRECIVLKKA